MIAPAAAKSPLLSAPKLSRSEAAAALGCSCHSVDRYARVGLRGHKLPKYRIGGKTHYLVKDVERWIRLLSDNTSEGHDPTAEADHAAAEAELSMMGV